MKTLPLKNPKRLQHPENGIQSCRRLGKELYTSSSAHLSAHSHLHAGGPGPTYAGMPGVDKVVPGDVYVSGCPPRPEALLYGLLRLQDKIRRENTVLRKERVIMAGRSEPILVEDRG